MAIGGRRDTDPSCGNGGGLATSRGDCPTDLFERGEAGQPGDCCAGQGVGSYRFRSNEKPPDPRGGGAVRVAVEAN